MWHMSEFGSLWIKVVVGVKVTSAKKNKDIKENEDTHREWTTRETMDKNVSQGVMAPLVISHDGEVHNESVRRWIDFSPDIKVDG